MGCKRFRGAAETRGRDSLGAAAAAIRSLCVLPGTPIFGCPSLSPSPILPYHTSLQYAPVQSLKVLQSGTLAHARLQSQKLLVWGL